MNIYTHYEQTAKVMNPHDAVSAAAFILEENTGTKKVNKDALCKYNPNRKVTIEKFNQITQELLKDSHQYFAQ